MLILTVLGIWNVVLTIVVPTFRQALIVAYFPRLVQLVQLVPLRVQLVQLVQLVQFVPLRVQLVQLVQLVQFIPGLLQLVPTKSRRTGIDGLTRCWCFFIFSLFSQLLSDIVLFSIYFYYCNLKCGTNNCGSNFPNSFYQCIVPQCYFIFSKLVQPFMIWFFYVQLKYKCLILLVLSVVEIFLIQHLTEYEFNTYWTILQNLIGKHFGYQHMYQRCRTVQKSVKGGRQ